MKKVKKIDWKKSIISQNASIKEAISNLDKTGLQIVLIADPVSYLFMGILTDGDIRRGILSGMRLDESVAPIIKSNPIVVSPGMNREAVLNLMQANEINHLPIVGAGKKIMGLHLWSTAFAPAPYENTMVIMAGGFGKRLRPYTENCPKPLLPIGDKPILEHIIQRAKQDGFKQFIISLHYLGDMIRDYFGDGSDLDVSIQYVEEHSPMGTAGALKLINPLPDLPIVVTNGDVLSDVHYSDMLEFHNSHQADATMAIKLHEWQNPYGVVKTDGVDLVGFEEKPVYHYQINAGIYVIEPSVIEYMLFVDGKSDMPSFFQQLGNRGKKTIVYPTHESWIDIGRPADYDFANTAELK